MSSMKGVNVLDNNVTLIAGAGVTGNTSTVWQLLTGYGGNLYLKNTNGATGPILAAQSQVWGSPDGTNWYKIGGAILWALGNAVVSSLIIPIPIGLKYVEVISGGNTGQDTMFRAEGVEVTAIS